MIGSLSKRLWYSVRDVATHEIPVKVYRLTKPFGPREKENTDDVASSNYPVFKGPATL